MGMQLPGELVSVLSMLGYTWPEADETKLLDMGQSWLDFAGKLQGPLADAGGNAQQVWSTNQGDAITAFQKEWLDKESPHTNMTDATTAAQIIGAGLIVCAGIVLALKIQVIVQLVLLAISIAQAIATAVPTLGASLLEIPIFKMIIGAIIDKLIDMALEAILGG